MNHEAAVQIERPPAGAALDSFEPQRPGSCPFLGYLSCHSSSFPSLAKTSDTLHRDTQVGVKVYPPPRYSIVFESSVSMKLSSHPSTQTAR